MRDATIAVAVFMQHVALHRRHTAAWRGIWMRCVRVWRKFQRRSRAEKLSGPACLWGGHST